MATVTATPTSAIYARHNLGPLTVPFEAPASCIYNIAECDTCTRGWRAQSCTFDGAYPVDDSACWPPRATYAPTTQPGFNGWGFYSPGTLCPSGYTPSCTKTNGLDGGFPFQYDLVSSETAIGCCPTGFSCTLDKNEKQTCVTIAMSTSITTATCPGQNSGQPSVFHYKTLPSSVPSSTISSENAIAPGSVVSNFTLLAPLFQLVFQPSDLTTTMGGPTATSSSDVSRSTAATSGASNQTTSDQGTTGGLSTGAAVGIGIGATAGLVGLLVLAYFAWRSKRRNRGPEMVSSAASSSSTGNPTMYSELSSAAMHQAPSSSIAPSELAASSEIHSQNIRPNTQDYNQKSLMSVKNSI
ncbi:hypothetical protein PFICI_00850 [Pestalotiopsis fici W106-1]|uniref:Uncharacterized protein n=1 Tax=Pestalotiopsis fici (strain W106-1 / CGMCC3.15140) TaxID=1229662 RepID=W3XNC6_PESFW|nr:uncharacterized protein PFICI_00850 [Pestalotiopsis fici W106-1]ETS87022.1 hypothetical protein PFICI_00850 [Pestalotiopsis fici W106-1]